MRLLIVGAGLSGIMAAKFFSGHDIFIREATVESVGLSHHYAVMHIRDAGVPLLLGCDYKKVTVHKSVYMDGHLSGEATVAANNLYSFKTTGEFGKKSITELGLCERYLLTDRVFTPGIKFENKLLSVDAEQRSAVFVSGKVQETGKYDFCISTIPLPFLVKILGVECQLKFEGSSIFVYKSQIIPRSVLHQVVYIPEKEFSTYRISVDERDVIFEAIAPAGEREFEKLLSAIGIEMNLLGDFSAREQPFGKMMMVDNAERKKLLHDITIKYRIFSLGRFAIWKPIRADHVLGDLGVIRNMMRNQDSFEYEAVKQNLGGD